MFSDNPAAAKKILTLKNPKETEKNVWFRLLKDDGSLARRSIKVARGREKRFPRVERPEDQELEEFSGKFCLITFYHMGRYVYIE
jgi:hypothetical protein